VSTAGINAASSSRMRTMRANHGHAIESVAPADIRVMQEQLLKQQLTYLFEHSPFHRRKLELAGRPDLSFRSLDDLANLPYTVKDEVRQSLQQAAPLGEHLAASTAELVQFHCSSGTTGRPSYVGLTAADLTDWVEVQRRCLWGAGLRPHDRVLQAFGMSRGWVGGLPIVQAVQALGASIIPAGAEPGTAWLLNVIRDLQPNALLATPNFAVYLGEQAPEVLGVAAHELTIRKIAVGGEPGGGIRSVRDRADGIWGAEMREMMGGGDICPVLWADCEERDGMHFMAADSVLFEIVSLENQVPLPIENGVVGELVYTHLRRQATPALRFRHGDIVTVVGRSCPCGRTTPKIRCHGRTDDMFIVKGVNVYPTAIQDIVVSMRPATTGALVVVKDTPEYTIPGPLHIRVERGDGTPPAEVAQLARQIESRVHDMLRCRVTVEILEPGTLPKPGREKVGLVEKRYLKTNKGGTP
jgi:phenylacetate-CoA ligase